MRLYPNPASEVLYLETTGLENGSDYRILLIDASGRTVHVKDLQSRIGQNTIDVGHLPSGLYHLILKGISLPVQKGATLLIK